MAQNRRTLLRVSALGLAGSISGFAGANRRQTQTTEQATPFTVQARTHREYGVILTDGAGMTLYRFTRDEDGESTCYDRCAEAWPPLTVEDSMGIPDGLPGRFGTAERRDGAMQVTYNEMPLYRFANDEEPGDANGQGVNGTWFVVNPACLDVAEQTQAASDDETTTTTETTEGDDGDGGGVGYDR